MIRSVF
jgi:hypothetical protein